jgi:hypothetical protein
VIRAEVGVSHCCIIILASALDAGGRNRKVAEAYVHAYQCGNPKSFDVLEV